MPRNVVPRPLPVDPDGTFDTRYWLRNDPLAMGPQGPGGPAGPQGIPGPQGDQGQAVRIRWTVATAGSLPTGPSVLIGDGALVGSAAPYSLYVYANDPPAWVNAGVMSAGPQGPIGPQGPVGPQPTLAGSGSASTAARSDHDHAGVYSPTGHNHDAVYSKLNHDHAGVYAPVSHDHDSVYSKLSHDHSGVYSPVAHTHAGVYAPASHEHAASHITSGTLDNARIPNMDASKITSGLFAGARIPNMDASKITSGLIGVSFLPKLPSDNFLLVTHKTNRSTIGRSEPEDTSYSFGSIASDTSVIVISDYNIFSTGVNWRQTWVPGRGIMYLNIDHLTKIS